MQEWKVSPEDRIVDIGYRRGPTAGPRAAVVCMKTDLLSPSPLQPVSLQLPCHAVSGPGQSLRAVPPGVCG